MHPIYIPHLLNASDRTQRLSFETFLDGLDTLTPIRAELSVRHGTTFLEVKGKAKAIVTLACDRCLQQYNHRLSIDAQEIIWLAKRLDSYQEEALEQEISSEELIESLSPDGYFEPDTWIYEQLCLELPQRQICDSSCQGIIPPKTEATSNDSGQIDHRWSALAVLKQQLALEGDGADD